jgi:hypothetical protein
MEEQTAQAAFRRTMEMDPLVHLVPISLPTVWRVLLEVLVGPAPLDTREPSVILVFRAIT